MSQAPPRRPQSVMSDYTVVHSPVLLEGFLWKKGAKGLTLGLKRRWFSLSNNKLYYFKSPEAAAGTELGYIDLRGEFEIEPNSDSESNCYFRIRTPNRVWHLTAEGEDERKFWVEGLTRFKYSDLKDSGNHQDVLDTFLGDQRKSEDGFSEVNTLLLCAEREIYSNQVRIEELNNDLENSIRIIKLKGEQVELLTQRLEKKEQDNITLRLENSQLRGMLAEHDVPITNSISEFHTEELSSNLQPVSPPVSTPVPVVAPATPVVEVESPPPRPQYIPHVPILEKEIDIAPVTPPERDLFLTSKLQETTAKLRVKTTLLEIADNDSRILSDFLQFLKSQLGNADSNVLLPPISHGQEAVLAWVNWIETQRKHCS